MDTISWVCRLWSLLFLACPLHVRFMNGVGSSHFINQLLTPHVGDRAHSCAFQMGILPYSIKWYCLLIQDHFTKGSFLWYLFVIGYNRRKNDLSQPLNSGFYFVMWIDYDKEPKCYMNLKFYLLRNKGRKMKQIIELFSKHGF